MSSLVNNNSSNRSDVVGAGLYDEQASVPTWSASATNAPRGYSSTVANQTGGAESQPSWMTGSWDMPSWGTNATTGETMSNEDLLPTNNTSLLDSLISDDSGSSDSGSIDLADFAALVGLDNQRFWGNQNRNLADSNSDWNEYERGSVFEDDVRDWLLDNGYQF